MSATPSASASASATSSVAVSIEEQHQQSITAPSPAITHLRAGSQPHSRDPMDDILGYSPAFNTHDSRHDDRRQSLADVPPPYAAEAAIPLPEYSLDAPEPLTLAMYLFKFGFLFPPFWFFGALILLSPLREPPPTSESIPAWMPEKTEEERRKIIADLREVELKWAERCLFAVAALIVLVAVASITAWLFLRH